MKVLVIGTDTAMFQPGSEARSRIEAYGRLFDELHIVLFSPSGFRSEALLSGVVLYPTNSYFVFCRPFDAARIGKRIVRERGIDVVSVQDPAESGLAGWLIKRATGLPLHIQLHTDILNPHFRRNSWKEQMRYWMARYLIPCGDSFRVVSVRIRDSLHSKFKIPNSKITVLPIFVDREAIAGTPASSRLRDRYPEFDFLILMVSRLNRDKRFNRALDAFRRLLDEFPKTGLVIVGDGPERGNLGSRIQDLGLSRNVRLEGWQNDPTLYYKGADLYLLTSAFEGYGRTVIEAAAAGLPVVMTDVGVAGDAIRDQETGRVVPVGDAGALTRALKDARRNYTAMRRMADRVQQEVLRRAPRTWSEYLNQYQASYENLLRH